MTNGYFELYKEVKKKNSSLSDNQLHERASEIWKNMSDKDKAYYKKIAKSLKGDGAKYNTQGIRLDVMNEFQAKREAEAAQETDHIKHIVEYAFEKNELIGKVFHLISTNYYCTTNEMDYITCEIALVPFSLAQGILEPLHTLVYSDKIPLGYASGVLNGSKRHGISPDSRLKNPDKALDTVVEIIARMQTAPVYCVPSQLKQVKNFIGRVTAKTANAGNIHIYSLSKLFFNIRNILTEEKGFPQISLVDMELQRDMFKYTQGLECDFHKTTELYYECALALCKRWAFIICDHCCKHVGIKLIPGQHVPKKISEDDYYLEGAPPLQSNVPQVTKFHYEPPKDEEQIFKETKWPSLGAPSGLSAAQGAIPKTQHIGNSAWGPKKHVSPMQGSYFDNNYAAGAMSPEPDDSLNAGNWPAPGAASTRMWKRKGKKN